MLRNLHPRVPSSFLNAATTVLPFCSLRNCSTTSNNNNNSAAVPPTHQAQTGPYEKVGNIFICYNTDIPAKYTPQINLILRHLRFEFRGQMTIHPDTPEIREKLFRVRHLVRVEMVSLDEAKEILGVPQHVKFRDLESNGLNNYRQVGPDAMHPYIRSQIRFRRYRKERIRDILERDQVELKLLDAKKNGSQ